MRLSEGPTRRSTPLRRPRERISGMRRCLSHSNRAITRARLPPARRPFSRLGYARFRWRSWIRPRIPQARESRRLRCRARRSRWLARRRSCGAGGPLRETHDDRSPLRPRQMGDVARWKNRDANRGFALDLQPPIPCGGARAAWSGGCRPRGGGYRVRRRSAADGASPRPSERCAYHSGQRGPATPGLAIGEDRSRDPGHRCRRPAPASNGVRPSRVWESKCCNWTSLARVSGICPHC